VSAAVSVCRRRASAFHQPNDPNRLRCHSLVLRDGAAVDQHRHLVDREADGGTAVRVGGVLGEGHLVGVAAGDVDGHLHERAWAPRALERDDLAVGSDCGRTGRRLAPLMPRGPLPSYMSEAETDERVAGRTDVWIEKYRPERLADIKGHEDIVPRLQGYVDRDDLSHMLFAGPAGTGKCMTGDTPVLTDDGIQAIEDIVGDVEGFSASDTDVRVLTFDERANEFRYTEPSQVFGKEAERTVEVETRDGADLQTTPEHKLLCATSGGLEWRRADDLQSGDRIVRPLQIPDLDTDTEIDWHERMDGERTFVTVSRTFAERHSIPAEKRFVGEKRRIFGLVREGKTVDELVDEDVSPMTAEIYSREASEIDLEAVSRTCSLKYLRSLDVDRETLRTHVESIQYVNESGGESRPITPPWEFTPDLGTLLGYVVGEARVDGGRIRFYNTEEQLLERFESILVERFDLQPDRMERKGVPMRRVVSKTLTHYLRSCFDVLIGGDDSPTGARILRAPEETRANFLRALFDGEAHVTENGIVELTQKDGDLITLISYLLSGFGIPSRRKTERKSATNGTDTKRTYHTLYVSSASHLERFQRRIGFGLAAKAARVTNRAAADSNPNHDTVPTQEAVDTLVDTLRLSKKELCRESLDPENPGRERYEETLEAVLEAANGKIEAAQRVFERLERLEGRTEIVTATPATWTASRSELAPLDVRKSVATETGVSTGRLLEYADGRRTPYADRVSTLLVELDQRETPTNLHRVRELLNDAVERLGISYESVADGTPHRGADIVNLLKSDGYELHSLPRFKTVSERLRTIAAEMCSEEVLAALSTLQGFVEGELYFDEVQGVIEHDEPTRVYDLTVPDTHNFVGGSVPTVVHNTASAVSIAKEIYGDDWQENFLELNASDQRGIDVVRDRIKSFARSSFGGFGYRIIFLDEADALTSDAQAALRRTMEQFSNNTRFILSCNYSSQIIDPIQSRCTVFRFSPLSDKAVADQVREIADAEGIELTDDGVDALVYVADGDMRAAINGLQAASVMGDVVDEDTVYTINSAARPEEVEELVTLALDGEFVEARARLDDLLTDRGIAGGDVIDQIHRSIWEFDLDDRAAVRVMDRVGEADYRITAGANERIQLEALLAALAREE